MKEKKKDRSRHVVHALERMLHIYEDASLAIDLISKAQQRGAWLFPHKMGKRIVHAPVGHKKFRTFLLDVVVDTFDIFKIEPYGGVDEDSLIRYPSGYQAMIRTNFPAALYRWNADSRRVFSLSSDIQLLLEHTDVKDIRIEDVPWPFDTFAIALSHPLSVGTSELDCILVTIVRDDAGKIAVFYIRLIPSGHAPNLTIPFIEKERLLRLHQKERWEEFGKLLVPHMDAWDAFQIGHFGTPCNISVNTCFEEHFSGNEAKVSYTIQGEHADTNEVLANFRSAINLAIGLSFYLTTCSRASGTRSDWQPLSKTQRLPDPRAITNAADVCMVSSEYKLSTEERRVFEGIQSGKADYELCAHFRRGHWRRPPGKGDDPMALKVVWVRPSLVRRDRLPQHALPGGSNHSL